MVPCAIESCRKTILNMQPEPTGDYHVTFLAIHPDDKHVCDDKSRW